VTSKCKHVKLFLSEESISLVARSAMETLKPIAFMIHNFKKSLV